MASPICYNPVKSQQCHWHILYKVWCIIVCILKQQVSAEAWQILKIADRNTQPRNASLVSRQVMFCTDLGHPMQNPTLPDIKLVWHPPAIQLQTGTTTLNSSNKLSLKYYWCRSNSVGLIHNFVYKSSLAPPPSYLSFHLLTEGDHHSQSPLLSAPTFRRCIMTPVGNSNIIKKPCTCFHPPGWVDGSISSGIPKDWREF